MKKILTFIITAIIINLAIISTNSLVFAITPTPPTVLGSEGDISKTTFDVNKWLDIDGGSNNQLQTYFDCKEGPIICFTMTMIDYATKVIGSIAMILLIISGFMLMLAQGNQQKLDEAKDIAKYAIIGLVITFMSYILTIFVQALFILK